jgi:hypothetical protein
MSIFNKVDLLVGKIKRDMDSRVGFGGPKGLDAKEIRSITKALSKMSKTDADQVFNKLEEMGLLGKFAQEVMKSPSLGKNPLSASDRGALFAQLASKLDGASMHALSSSFQAASAINGNRGVDYLGEISNAMAIHGSHTQKVDFLRTMSEQGAAYDRVLGSFQGNTAASARAQLGLNAF